MKRPRKSFTHVDPFEDTERLGDKVGFVMRAQCFTHVDPFEDTERSFNATQIDWPVSWFHPRRSVRGY